MTQNDSKWLKMTQNDSKWLKMTQNDSTCSKWLKVTQNGSRPLKSNLDLLNVDQNDPKLLKMTSENVLIWLKTYAKSLKMPPNFYKLHLMALKSLKITQSDYILSQMTVMTPNDRNDAKWP